MRRLLLFLLVAAALLSQSVARAQDGSFNSAGVELYYTSAGTGTPIVLLSGGPGLNIEYMLPVAQFLPSGYRSIGFEQRGTGRSRAQPFDPATLTLHTVVQDLKALRVRLLEFQQCSAPTSRRACGRRHRAAQLLAGRRNEWRGRCGDKTAEDIRALIAGSKLVYINRCGHFPWIEQPEAFRKAIADFLSTPAQ